MKPTPPPLDPAAALIDSDYDSADDSDFDPSSAAAATAAAPGDHSDDDDDDLSASSSGEGDDEAGDAKPTPRPRKRKRALSTSSETASGGTVQTRAQRARGAKSTHPQAARLPSGAVTTDVDALWAEMNSSSARPGPSTTTTIATSTTTPSTTPATTPTTTTTTTTPTPAEAVHPDTGEKMVTITHTYEFAGKTVTEEKLVPASSETARVHFSSTTATASSTSSSPATGSRSSTAPARRPPPKKRASAFDSAAASRSTNGNARHAHHCQPAKINTLEKSRMDWAGFVDKEGIGDDLKRWNKGEKGYLDRQAFLGRVDENRDRQWKEAHKK